jgi:glycosyltransferase involved in cell wall biosynthesis
LVLPEAMASGLPAVATAVGGVPGVVEDGVTGLLVPPRNAEALRGAIRQLVENPHLARRMGVAAYTRACSHHSRSSMAARYLEVYLEASVV